MGSEMCIRDRCGPVWFYLLFVSDIWWWVVSWFEHVLLSSYVKCLHLLTLGTCCVPHACPLSSTLCSLPHATGLVWSCMVLLSFCFRHLVCVCVALFVHVLLPSSVICEDLLHPENLLCASCMPSALHSLPSASCHWPCVAL